MFCCFCWLLLTFSPFTGFGREMLQDNIRRRVVITTEEELQTAVGDLTSGDRIIINAPNLTLTETLRLDVDDVVIRGQTRSTSKIICPNNGNGSAFYITGDSIRIHSLDFSGCLQASAVVIDGMDEEREGNVSVQLTHVHFTRNGRKDLPVLGAGLRVDACSEINCSVVSVNILTSTFEGNQGDRGAGIYAAHTRLYISNSLFHKNDVSSSGGALYIEGQRSALTVEASAFSNNTCALNFTSRTGMNATNKTSARREGGAISASCLSKVQLKDSSFTKNTACYGGGAIMFKSEDLSVGTAQASSFAMENCTFTNNAAHCHITNQNGIQQLFGLLEQSGGALASYADGTIPIQWSVKNSSFSKNEGDNGGAIYISSRPRWNHTIEASDFDSNVCDTSGGSILIAEGHLRLFGVSMTRCRGLYGGGLMLFRAATMHAFSLDDRPTIFESNEAFYGGALLCTAQYTISIYGVIFRNNTAFHQGGAIRLDDSLLPIEVHGALFENNRALLGGAMGTSAAGNLTLTSYRGQRTIFINNTALVGGGLDYSPGHFILLDMTFNNTSFLGNHAISIDEIKRRNSSPRDRVGQEPDHIDDFMDKILPQVPVDDLASVLSSRTDLSHGHGGGLSLTIINIFPVAIVECVFSNVEFKWNTGRVGGGLSLHLPELSWNKPENLHCFPAYFVIDTCRIFLFENVTITENHALYAGGLFSTRPNFTRLTCDRDQYGFNKTVEDLLVQQINPYVTPVFQSKDVCTWIENNTILDGEDVEGADAGSIAASLYPVGCPGPLNQVASGDRLTAPCPSLQSTPCSKSLQILIKDTYNQTIVRGIKDAEMQLTIESNNIAGETGYSAVRGVATINKTTAVGIGIESNITIQSFFRPQINIVRNFSTRTCQIGEYTQEQSCVRCTADQYGFNSSLDHCHSCESESYCPGGAALVPIEGYWHSTPFAPQMHPCFVEAACTFANRGQMLAAYYNSIEEVETKWKELNAYVETGLNRPYFPGYNQCAPGYYGILCGSCDEGYGKSVTGSCIKCPKRKAITRLLSAAVLVWVLLIVGVNSAITLASTKARIDLFRMELQMQRLRTRRPPRLGRAAHVNADLAERSAARTNNISVRYSEPEDLRAHWLLSRHLITTVQLTETLKILVNYLQVVSTALRLQIHWSKSMEGLMAVEAAFVGVASESIDAPLECNFENDHEIRPATLAIWSRAFSPVVVLLVLVFIFTLVWVLFHYNFTRKNDLAEKLKKRLGHTSWLTCMIVVCIVTIHFSYIGIVREMLRAVNCSTVDEEPESQNTTYSHCSIEHGHKVWVEDTSLTCFRGEHLATGIGGIIGLVFAWLAVVFIIVWLPLNKKHTKEPQFIARYWFLYQAYRREWYTSSWEAVILVRKAMIAAVVVFSVHLGPSLQATLCVGILSFAHIIQVVIRPFKVEEEQEIIPEYFNPVARVPRLKSTFSNWIDLSNSVSLNGLESAALLSAAVCFYCGIVLNDAHSSTIGRTAMTTVAMFVNLLFLVYMLFRLYAGIHTALDLYIESVDPAFMMNNLNGPGVWTLCKKMYRAVSIHREKSEIHEGSEVPEGSEHSSCELESLQLSTRGRVRDSTEITQSEV